MSDTELIVARRERDEAIRARQEVEMRNIRTAHLFPEWRIFGHTLAEIQEALNYHDAHCPQSLADMQAERERLAALKGATP